MIIHDYSGLFRIIQDYSGLFEIIHDYSWLLMIIQDYSGVSPIMDCWTALTKPNIVISWLWYLVGILEENSQGPRLRLRPNKIKSMQITYLYLFYFICLMIGTHISNNLFNIKVNLLLLFLISHMLLLSLIMVSHVKHTW